MADLESIITKTEAHMQTSLEGFRKELASVRTGQANAKLLDQIKLDVYGQFLPLSQAASIAASDAKTLTVTVWDTNNVKAADAAIKKSDLNLNPRVEGNKLFISLPELTSDRRQELIKLVKKKSEEKKVALRNLRRDSNDELKKFEKKKEISEDELKVYLDRIQKCTDKFIHHVDDLLNNKQKELETI